MTRERYQLVQAIRRLPTDQLAGTIGVLFEDLAESVGDTDVRLALIAGGATFNASARAARAGRKVAQRKQQPRTFPNARDPLRCPYPSHAEDCDCGGAGGDR